METAAQDLSKMTLDELQQLPYSVASEEMNRRARKKDEDRKAYKDLVFETVPKVFEKLKEINELMRDAKVFTYKSVEDILKLKHDVFESEDQQSHQFSDGKFQFKIGYRVYDRWDDTFRTGVAKIQGFIESLSSADDQDEKSKAISKTLKLLMKYDKDGNPKASRVIDLRNLAEEINHPDLHDGVSIIEKSHRSERSDWFIEASYRDENDEWKPLALNMSAIRFPEDFKFSFSPKIEI